MRDVLLAIHDLARREPHRPAITTAHESMTYAALDRAIAQARAKLADSPDTVGLLMSRSIAWIVTDLALASLGRTIVPLPDFFSPDQWRHMIANADIGAIVTDAGLSDRLAELSAPLIELGPAADSTDADPRFAPLASCRIIYTSGTTGQPKGVVLDESAMAASLHGLETAVAAAASDVHLSVLPFSLLLEQIAGILLPLKWGARLHIAASPAEFMLSAGHVRPTTTILVPELLSAWVDFLRQNGLSAPSSLRFAAVGGAPVGTALAEDAWSVGIPVHEGYGLSECCSVVAVNRPGARCPGTVGRPLDTVDVAIEDGEIVVRGPTVMRGYLGGPAPDGVWHTGDLGEWDADGHLVVHGRKDDVIVTQAGRNVHPAWIETMLLADPAIARAAVIAGHVGVKAVLVVKLHDKDDWLSRVRDLTAAAPDYARPTEVAVLSPEDAQRHALFTLDGRPRRRLIAQFLSEEPMNFYEALVDSTTPDRKGFLSIPVIQEAVANGVDTTLYLAFLNSAYHHVRYTVPLLEAARTACGPDDAELAAGLTEYIREETGHEEWILDDITALGGDRDATRNARPPLPVRAMVAYAFHLIAEEGPYAMLGMVHVLEGMSVALATKAADSIRAHLDTQGPGGFSYLTSHGSLDVDHVATFADLLGAIDTPERRQTVIAAAKDFYRLYGDVFRALDARHGDVSHAA